MTGMTKSMAYRAWMVTAITIIVLVALAFEYWMWVVFPVYENCDGYAELNHWLIPQCMGGE